MADFDYADLVNEVETTLRGDERMEHVHITQEPETVTIDQCPAVIVQLDAASIDVKRMVAGGGPGAEDMRVTLTLQCWEFSGQGAAAAARARDALVRSVRDVLRDSRGLNGKVQWLETPNIRFNQQPGEAGIYAVGMLTLVCLAQV